MKSRELPSAQVVPPSSLLHAGYPESVRARVNTFAIFALLLFVILGPLIVAMQSQSGASSGEGNFLRQLGYISIFAMALFTVQVVRFPAVLLTPPKSLLLMLGWCSLSILWAINPEVGARRLFLTLIIIWSVFLLVEKAGYEKTVHSVRQVLLLVLVANYAAVVAYPSLGIHQFTEEDLSIVGAWRGVLTQKNFAGAVCALTVLFFAFDAKKIRLSLRLAVLAGALVFLFYSNSRTSMGLLASSFMVVGLYRLYNPYYRWAVFLFMVPGVVLSGVLAYEYWDWIAEPFSRQDALTGRVQIWPVLIRYWQENWLLGSGFGSFWNVGEPNPISMYSRGWIATSIFSGHNGFLDLLVQTGLPGLMLAVLAAFIVPLVKLFTHTESLGSRANLILACIWFCVGHNLTESSLFDRDATVHVFLMLSIAMLGTETRQR